MVFMKQTPPRARKDKARRGGKAEKPVEWRTRGDGRNENGATGEWETRLGRLTFELTGRSHGGLAVARRTVFCGPVE